MDPHDVAVDLIIYIYTVYTPLTKRHMLIKHSLFSGFLFSIQTCKILKTVKTVHKYLGATYRSYITSFLLSEGVTMYVSHKYVYIGLFGVIRKFSLLSVLEKSKEVYGSKGIRMSD